MTVRLAHEVEVLRAPPAPRLEELSRRISDYLADTAVTRAIVFGSFARGEQDGFSDLDLLLIEPTSRPPLERGRQHLALFRLGVGLDLLVLTPAEYQRLCERGAPLACRIAQEGVVIYEAPPR